MKRNIILAIAAAILLIGCGKETKVVKKEDVIKVITESVKETDYYPVLKYSASIFACKEANLGTVLPGKIEKYYFQEGDIVQAGSVIAELSDELLQQAEIEYRTYKKDFERMERLRAKGSVPEMEYDHIKALYEAKKENYDMIRKNTQITAPFSGTIIEYLVQEGENYLFNLNLEPGYSKTSGVVRLMDLSKVKVEFEVGEKDIANIKRGLETEISLSAYPEMVFKGRITECNSYLNHLSRTMKATVVLDNQEGYFKPGMFAEVTVKLPSESGIMIPAQAIQRLSGTGEDIVYTVKSKKVERNIVNRLFTNQGLVAVSGLQTGDKVIVSGKSKVESGQQVNVINEEE